MACSSCGKARINANGGNAARNRNFGTVSSGAKVIDSQAVKKDSPTGAVPSTPNRTASRTKV